jgi:hypothetical protein
MCSSRRSGENDGTFGSEALPKPELFPAIRPARAASRIAATIAICTKVEILALIFIDQCRLANSSGGVKGKMIRSGREKQPLVVASELLRPYERPISFTVFFSTYYFSLCTKFTVATAS